MLKVSSPDSTATAVASACVVWQEAIRGAWKEKHLEEDNIVRFPKYSG